jgi:hypothetical protein
MLPGDSPSAGFPSVRLIKQNLGHISFAGAAGPRPLSLSSESSSTYHETDGVPMGTPSSSMRTQACPLHAITCATITNVGPQRPLFLVSSGRRRFARTARMNLRSHGDAPLPRSLPVRGLERRSPSCIGGEVMLPDGEVKHPRANVPPSLTACQEQHGSGSDNPIATR